MALTYKNIQDRILEFGYGEADRDRIKNYINQAYRDIASRYRWAWTEGSEALTTTASQGYTLVPPALDYFGRLRPGEAGLDEPRFVDWHGFNETFLTLATDELAEGVPEVYSLYNELIYWYPVPIDTFSYIGEGWIVPDDLSADADEPLIPPTDRDVLVMGGLKYAAMRDKDLNMYNTYSAEFEGMVNKMKRKTNLRQTETPRRIAMPYDYRGAYD